MKTVEEILEVAFTMFDNMSPTDPEKGKAALKLADILVQVNIANQLRKVVFILSECLDSEKACLRVFLESNQPPKTS